MRVFGGRQESHARPPAHGPLGNVEERFILLVQTRHVSLHEAVARRPIASMKITSFDGRRVLYTPVLSCMGASRMPMQTEDEKTRDVKANLIQIRQDVIRENLAAMRMARQHQPHRVLACFGHLDHTTNELGNLRLIVRNAKGSNNDDFTGITTAIFLVLSHKHGSRKEGTLRIIEHQ